MNGARTNAVPDGGRSVPDAPGFEVSGFEPPIGAEPLAGEEPCPAVLGSGGGAREERLRGAGGSGVPGGGAGGSGVPGTGGRAMPEPASAGPVPGAEKGERPTPWFPVPVPGPDVDWVPAPDAGG
jgi:hypothetical protein